MARSLLLMLCLGCAAQNQESPPPREVEKVVKEPVSEPAPTPPAAPKGIIERAQLTPVLDAGPGAFLSHVDVAPRFSQGRFQGWRVRSFFPGDERFAGVNLQAGDVVLRVNGRSVEKPDQLMEVWQSLRAANSLEVEVERNGAPMQLRWPIQP